MCKTNWNTLSTPFSQILKTVMDFVISMTSAGQRQHISTNV